MATFLLRNVDNDLWQQFRVRARAEGHTLRWVIMALITRYVRQGLPHAR